VTGIDFTVDTSTGIAIVRQAPGFRVPQISGTGYIVYRCHTCGDLIPKAWEVFFLDPAGDGWAGYILPPVMPATMTTHHDWHLQETD